MSKRKITAFILAALMIFAPLGVIGVGAGGYAPLTLSAADVSVDAGAATADVVVTLGNIPTDLGIGAASFNASVSGGAKIQNITKLVSPGSGAFSNSSFMWCDYSTGVFDESVEFAKITVELPAGAFGGSEFNVTLGVFSDPDYCLTFNEDQSTGDTVGLGATVIRNAKITVVGGETPNYSPITLSAADVSVNEGATSAEVVVSVGNIPRDLGLASVKFSAAASGGAQVTNITSLMRIGSASYQNGVFLWSDASDGAFASSVELAKITVNLPAGAKAGDVFDVVLTANADPDNFLTFNASPAAGKTLGLGATVARSAKITVKADGAAAYSPITISAADVRVRKGQSEAEVIVSLGNIPTDLGLGAAVVRATVFGGASIAGFKKLVSCGTSSSNSSAFSWADADDGIFDKTVDLVKIRVAIPEDAGVGSVYYVILNASDDPDNYLTFNASPATGATIGLGATVERNARITIVPDYPPVTVSAPDIEVNDTDSEAVFDVSIGGISETLGLSSVFFSVKVPGAKVKSISPKLSGSFYTSDLPAEEATFMWVDQSNGVFTPSAVVATVTVSLDGIEGGSVLPIIITPDVDPDNYLSFNEEDGDQVGFGAEAANGSITISEHKHNLAAVGRTEPGCETDGVKAHYACSVCGKTFSDADGKIPFDPAIAALGHDIVHVDATEPTCDAPGYAEHNKCSRCGKVFATGSFASVEYPETPDAGQRIVIKAPIVRVAEGTTSVDVAIVLDNIPADLGLGSTIYSLELSGGAMIAKGSNKLGGNSTFKAVGADAFPAPASSHGWASMDGIFSGPVTIAVYTITLPEGLTEGDEIALKVTPSPDNDNFLTIAEVNGDTLGLGGFGVSGKIVVTKAEASLEDLIIPALGHTLEHVPAVEPQIDKDGNIEYWKCTVCGKYFADADAKTEISADAIVAKFPYEPGDANGDGKVNSRDVMLVMKAVLPGFEPTGKFIFEAADMNGDGKINSRDVILVMNEVIRRNAK